mmetsp:Transcript_70691/g.188700  ORF Transcript_70691/g.188700 Transcript_70691/m.188700 type:complete len:142 (-) Transcript_70691:438-863(-)
MSATENGTNQSQPTVTFDVSPDDSLGFRMDKFTVTQEVLEEQSNGKGLPESKQEDVSELPEPPLKHSSQVTPQLPEACGTIKTKLTDDFDANKSHRSLPAAGPSLSFRHSTTMEGAIASCVGKVSFQQVTRTMFAFVVAKC